MGSLEQELLSSRKKEKKAVSQLVGCRASNEGAQRLLDTFTVMEKAPTKASD